MQFRPCIDIHNGKVKQIIGSTLNDDYAIENFIAQYDAAYFAEMYKKDNLLGGHAIMLDQSQETRKEALKALQAFPDGLQIGGGINADNAKEFINAKASHVIVSSYIFLDGKLAEKKLKKLVNIVGKDKLVLDLSCRKKKGKYYAVINRWQTFTDFEINKNNLEKLSKYCDEFLIHGVDSEGKKQGIENDLINILKDIKSISITYAGGIKDVEDIEKIKKSGKGGINFTVGSALDIFGGSLEYKKIVENYNK